MFVYDGEILEQELADVTASEIIANFNELTLKLEIIRIDASFKMPCLKENAYERFEK